MIRTTLWRPDTCGCVIEYEWDDTVSESERTHSISKVVEACEAHKGLTAEELYATVGDENKRKNIALGHILENTPSLGVDAINTQGKTVKQFKDGIIFDFAYDKGRVLHLTFGGKANLNATQKSTLQTLANSKFGNGKVKVE